MDSLVKCLFRFTISKENLENNIQNEADSRGIRKS